MRWAIAEIFENLVSPLAKEFKNVAILGGTRNDSEHLVVGKLNKNLTSTVYGIEDLEKEDQFFDLNDEHMADSTYDLLLCSQVIEHIWDHQNFFDNIAKLSHSGSYVWINCPASNFAHGSPEYYSAGFTSSYLSNNLKKRNFKIIDEGQIGSERYYKVLHLTHQWISEELHAKLLFGSPVPGKRLRSKIRSLVIRLLSHLPLVLTNSKPTQNLKYATESWVLAVKQS